MQYRRSTSRFRSWLIPALYTAGAIVLGLLLPRTERYFFPNLASSISISAAMAIYSAIASGMMALTGIVFSLAFVMAQFSSIAYSPRLVMWVARDPVLTHALGLFIATFTYAVAALAWLDRGGVTVPLISAAFVVLLLIGSMGMFVALIQRIGLLQVGRMLAFTGAQGRQVITTMYRPIDDAEPPDELEFVNNSSPRQTIVHRGSPQAIQSFDLDRLVEIAELYGAVIEVVASVGDVVIELTPILHVFGATEIPEESLRNSIQLGEDRTFDQDPKYAIRLLVDIAIKALSPAINDPTSATQALNEIGDLLVRLGRCRIEVGIFRGPGGTLRLVVPFPSWDDFLRLAFDEIRCCGATSIQIMRRMKALVSDLIALLPEERHPALREWQQRLHGTVIRSFQDNQDVLEASVEDRQGFGTTRRCVAANR